MLSEEQLAQLAAPLEESRVSHRQGMSYLEAWDCIAKANEIFGYTNWSYTVQRLERETFGWLAVVRLEVGGVVREDVGYTDYAPLDNVLANVTARDTDMAMKGAVSDGLKRCLRTFGPQFGNSLYDKDRAHGEGALRQQATDDEMDDCPQCGSRKKARFPVCFQCKQGGAKESTVTTGARPKLALCKVHDKPLLKTGSHSRLAHPQDGKWCFGETAIDIPEGTGE